MKNLFVRNSLLVLSLFSAVSFSGQVSSASACKGLDNAACGSNSACSWVEGYQRKDGRQVKAFCRTKPSFKKSAVKKSAASAKTSAAVKTKSVAVK